MFSQMIPKNFKRIWKEGFNTNKYYLKLCGAGGGGYLLGFCKKESLSEIMNLFPLQHLLTNPDEHFYP